MTRTTHRKFIVTKQDVGRREAPTDWLICWSYKSAIAQAHYRTKLVAATPSNGACELRASRSLAKSSTQEALLRCTQVFAANEVSGWCSGPPCQHNHGLINLDSRPLS